MRDRLFYPRTIDGQRTHHLHVVTTTDDPDTYTRAKTELVQELVDKARSDRGLPVVPVWED